MKNFLYPAVIVGTLPVTLANGTTADATPVMSDLNWIVNQVNANAAPLVGTALTNANNNFTVVQSGQAATQAANFPIASQVQNSVFTTLSSTLGTNTVTARIAALALPAYVTGQVFTFLPSQINSGDTTMSIDGLTAKHFLNAGSALSGGELRPLIPKQFYYDGVRDAFPILDGTPFVQGPNVPSASTLNLDAVEGDYNKVDNTTAITAITLSRGRLKWLEFTSSPVITSGGSLILPGTVNFQPNPGDVVVARGEAGGVVRCSPFPSSRLTGTVGGNEVLLGAVTISNVAQVSFTHLGGNGDKTFDWTAYDIIDFYFVQVAPATNATNVEAQISEDSGTTYKAGAGTYEILDNRLTDAAGASNNPGTTTSTAWIFTYNSSITNGTDYGFCGRLRVFNPSNLIRKSVMGEFTYVNSAGNFQRIDGAWLYNADAGAWTGIKFFMDSGNLSVGKIYAIGHKKT